MSEFIFESHLSLEHDEATKANAATASVYNERFKELHLNCDLHPSSTNVIKIKDGGKTFEPIRFCCSNFENTVLQRLGNLF